MAESQSQGRGRLSDLLIVVFVIVVMILLIIDLGGNVVEIADRTRFSTAAEPER